MATWPCDLGDSKERETFEKWPRSPGGRGKGFLLSWGRHCSSDRCIGRGQDAQGHSSFLGSKCLGPWQGPPASGGTCQGTAHIALAGMRPPSQSPERYLPNLLILEHLSRASRTDLSIQSGKKVLTQVLSRKCPLTKTEGSTTGSDDRETDAS